MRFWITKNSEVPVKEQLVRQVLLGILSEDLPPGQKLPSVRALARRHRIHANTVSAAYHDLLERGWLELRRGSGLYVRASNTAVTGELELDHLLAALLKTASRRGHEPEEVLRHLEHLVRPRAYERILVVEPERGLQAILRAEIAEHVHLPIESIAPAQLAHIPNPDRLLIVTLPAETIEVRRRLPLGAVCVPLRLRSVPASLDGQPRPRPDAILSIVSKSAAIRNWARIMLIAVGLDPDSLCEIDPHLDGWRLRLQPSALIVTDILTARELPPGCPVKVFRLIADSSITELKQLCPA